MATGRPHTGRLDVRQCTLVALLCWCLLAGLHWAGHFSKADLRLSDLRYRVRGERMAAEAIALVEVNDETFAAYGRSQLPRDQYALLLRALADAGAQAVGVDLLFVGADAEDPLSDRLLVAVTDEFRNVCHAISFLTGPSVAAEGTPSAEAEEILSHHGIRAGHGVRAAVAEGVVLPFTELLGSSHAIGHVNLAVDRDGSIRRLPLFLRYEGSFYPALSLRLAALARGYEPLPRVEGDRAGFTIVWPDETRLSVPMDDEGGTAIDFAGGPGAYSRSYSVLQVLRWYQEGNQTLLSEAFGGRTVLIGNTAVGQDVTDLCTTPFAADTPMVYVHANAVDAILRGRFLSKPPRSLVLLVGAGLSVLLGCLVGAVRFPRSAAVAGSALGLAAALDYGLFALRRVDMPTSLSLLAPVLLYGGIEAYRGAFLRGLIPEWLLRPLRIRVPLPCEASSRRGAGCPVFISYKHTNADGSPTRDSEIAGEVYRFLSSRGISAFLSSITLEHLGTDRFKKAIDEALDAAQILIAVGTTGDNLNAGWVRYECDSFIGDTLSEAKPHGRAFVYTEDLPNHRLPPGLRHLEAFEHGPDGMERLYGFIVSALESTEGPTLDRSPGEKAG